MAIYWVNRIGTQVANSPAGQQIIDELSAWAIGVGATMVTLAGACWLFCDDPPAPADINLGWDTGINYCCEHPYAGCVLAWGCDIAPA